MNQIERLSPRSRPIAPVILILFLAALASPLRAQACTVPGSHSTIQEAGDTSAWSTTVP